MPPSWCVPAVWARKLSRRLLSVPGTVVYRAGYFTHYAGEGAVKSCKIGHGGEQVDLCTCRTRASFSEEGDTRIVTLDPVTIEFHGFSVRVQTIFRLTEGTGEIEIIRKVLDSTDLEAEISIDEYITACYGTTEYPEDMTGIRLSLTQREQDGSHRVCLPVPRGGDAEYPER